MSNKTETLSLPAGEVLSVVTAGAWVGSVQRLGNKAGEAVLSTTTLAAGSTYRFGPFTTASWWKINQTSGSYSYSSALSFDATSSNVGVAASGVTAAEYGDGRNHVTVLTVDTALPSIAGGANLAVGKLLYTLPAGVCVVNGSNVNLAITQTAGDITADTPDGGLGTTIGSGVNAVLSASAAFENIMTGQAFNDCNGTAEVKTVDTRLVIEAAGDHGVYFNVADGWASPAGSPPAEPGALLTGTVTLFWTFLG